MKPNTLFYDSGDSADLIVEGIDTVGISAVFELLEVTEDEMENVDLALSGEWGIMKIFAIEMLLSASGLASSHTGSSAMEDWCSEDQFEVTEKLMAEMLQHIDEFQQRHNMDVESAELMKKRVSLL